MGFCTTECFQTGHLHSFYFQSNQWHWHFKDLALHLKEAFTTVPASNRNYSGHLPHVLGWDYFTTAIRKVFSSCPLIIWAKRLKTDQNKSHQRRYEVAMWGGIFWLWFPFWLPKLLPHSAFHLITQIQILGPLGQPMGPSPISKWSRLLAGNHWLLIAQRFSWLQRIPTTLNGLCLQ